MRGFFVLFVVRHGELIRRFQDDTVSGKDFGKVRGINPSKAGWRVPMFASVRWI